LFTQSSVCNAPATSFPLSKHTGGGDIAPGFLRPAYLFTARAWEVVLPPSPVEFSSSLLHSHKLSCSLLLGTHPFSCPFRSGLACLFRVLGGILLHALQHSGSPTLFAMCLYCSYCLLLSFSFFPGWGSICPGGYADLAQGCLWEYHVPHCSPCGLCLTKPSGRRHLVAWGPS
jgi:hypothetical protein